MKTKLIFCLVVFFGSLVALPFVIRWEKDQQFKKCIENQGDMGCDSCYYAVYRKHIDTYSLFK